MTEKKIVSHNEIREIINKKFINKQKGQTMKCDNCGRPTDKNYFTDDLTVLCADCAASGQFMSGDAAKRFIQNKCDANKPPKSMYHVSFDVEFDIGYGDGIKRKLCEVFGAFNLYEIEITEQRE